MIAYNTGMPFKDPEKARAYHKEKHARYMRENPEKMRQQHREAQQRLRAKDPEKAKSAGRKYSKEFRQRHPERVLKTNRNWYAKNLEKARMGAIRRLQRFIENNPAAYIENNRRGMAKRRARVVGASGTFTQEQLEARIAFFGDCCAYCGGPYQHLDHAIALSKGGTNWPANFRPSCAKCNCSKNDGNWRDWKPII